MRPCHEPVARTRRRPRPRCRRTNRRRRSPRLRGWPRSRLHHRSWAINNIAECESPRRLQLPQRGAERQYSRQIRKTLWWREIPTPDNLRRWQRLPSTQPGLQPTPARLSPSVPLRRLLGSRLVVSYTAKRGHGRLSPASPEWLSPRRSRLRTARRTRSETVCETPTPSIGVGRVCHVPLASVVSTTRKRAWLAIIRW